MVDISDGFLSLMDDSGEVRDDVRCPDNDLGKDISARFEKDEQLLVGFAIAQCCEYFMLNEWT